MVDVEYAWRRLTGRFGDDKDEVLGIVKNSNRPMSRQDIRLALSMRNSRVVDGRHADNYLQVIIDDLFDSEQLWKKKEYTLGDTSNKYYVRK